MRFFFYFPNISINLYLWQFRSSTNNYFKGVFLSVEFFHSRKKETQMISLLASFERKFYDVPNFAEFPSCQTSLGKVYPTSYGFSVSSTAAPVYFTRGIYNIFPRSLPNILMLHVSAHMDTLDAHEYAYVTYDR